MSHERPTHPKCRRIYSTWRLFCHAGAKKCFIHLSKIPISALAVSILNEMGHWDNTIEANFLVDASLVKICFLVFWKTTASIAAVPSAKTGATTDIWRIYWINDRRYGNTLLFIKNNTEIDTCSSTSSRGEFRLVKTANLNGETIYICSSPTFLHKNRIHDVVVERNVTNMIDDF